MRFTAHESLPHRLACWTAVVSSIDMSFYNDEPRHIARLSCTSSRTISLRLMCTRVELLMTILEDMSSWLTKVIHAGAARSSEHEETWHCQHCTYLNDGPTLVCEVCSMSRHQPSAAPSDQEVFEISDSPPARVRRLHVCLGSDYLTASNKA